MLYYVYILYCHMYMLSLYVICVCYHCYVICYVVLCIWIILLYVYIYYETIPGPVISPAIRIFKVFVPQIVLMQAQAQLPCYFKCLYHQNKIY